MFYLNSLFYYARLLTDACLAVKNKILKTTVWFSMPDQLALHHLDLESRLHVNRYIYILTVIK